MPERATGAAQSDHDSAGRGEEPSTVNVRRRSAIKLLGAAAVTGSLGVAGAVAERRGPPQWRLSKVGHSLLSDPVGEYAEGQLRADGRYGVVGTYSGGGGSFFVDLEDPSRPTELHNVPAQSRDARTADVKFDPRHEVYYRSQESHETDGPSVGNEGVLVIDYGYGTGTPETPEILTHIPSGDTHNVFPHPDQPILYTVDGPLGSAGVKVWDVTDPAAPQKVVEAGPSGYCHDVVYDPGRELLHAAYMSGDFEGYAIFDASDPWRPEIVGRFDYGNHQGYSETEEAGEEGFGSGHFANYDPRRDLVVVGDEKGEGVPGGKHIFDIGYDQGSPTNPVPISFFVSPNAERQDRLFEVFDWTGHNFTVIPKGNTTLLASSDYKDGVVLYDITDPTSPEPIDQYLTDDRADNSSETLFPAGDPPMAFGIDYNDRQNRLFVSDMVTGVYTFELTRKPTTE